MRKILLIFFLIIIYVIIITKKIDQAFVEKIDLNLKQNEMGITFISLDDSKSLLINKGSTKILMVLKYLNNHKINDVLKMFNVKKLDYILMNGNYNISVKTNRKEIIPNKKMEISDMEIINDHDVIKIDYLNHRFCIFEKSNPVRLNGDCQYIYFLNINKNVSINDETNMIFYNEGTNPIFLEPVYDKWIDIYVIKKDYYVTLKLDEDNYDTITVPLDKNDIQTE